MIMPYILLLIVIVALAVFHIMILPKLFFVQYNDVKPIGRGIKKVIEPDSITLICEPHINYQRYINQYILSNRDGKVQLLCKIKESVRYICYSVALFNRNGMMFRILHIKELITNIGYTRLIDLPEETSFVSIYLNQADGNRFENYLYRCISRSKKAIFFVICAAIEFAFLYGLRLVIGASFGGIYEEYFLFDLVSNIVAVVSALVVVGINTAITLFAIQSAKKRFMRGMGEIE